MKTKKGFNLRDVCGEKCIAPQGKNNIDCTNIISMNESSAYLWQEVVDRDFTKEDLVKLLMQEYDVDICTARNDIDDLVKQWIQAGIIEC